MARVAIDGTIKVVFTQTISNMAEPTIGELTNGTELSTWITKDGLNTPADVNNVDDSALTDTFDAQVPGTFGGALELTMKRDDTTDTAWDLVTYGLEGFIVIRRQKDWDDAFAAADDVEVYPGAWHQKIPVTPASNEQHRFTVQFPVRSPGPELEAAVTN
jgi:hypothetical protein